MKRFLEKSLKIYEHEIPRFVWLAVIFFAGYTIFFSVTFHLIVIVYVHTTSV